MSAVDFTCCSSCTAKALLGDIALPDRFVTGGKGEVSSKGRYLGANRSAKFVGDCSKEMGECSEAV